MPSEGMLKVGGGWELAFAKVVKALKMHKNFCFLFYMSEKLRNCRKNTDGYLLHFSEIRSHISQS